MLGSDTSCDELFVIFNISQKRLEKIIAGLIKEKWRVRPLLLFNEW